MPYGAIAAVIVVNSAPIVSPASYKSVIPHIDSDGGGSRLLKSMDMPSESANIYNR